MPIKTNLELMDAARQLASTLTDEKSDLKITKSIIDAFDETGLDETDFNEFQNQVRNERNVRQNLKARPTTTQARLDKEAAETKK